MDPKAMMDLMQGFGKGGKTGPELSSFDEYGLKNMMDMMKQVEKDPELKRQMEGYWKMLDSMSSNNPDEYKKFVESQMSEMKQAKDQEEKIEQKNQTITSEAYFNFSVRPVKLIDASKKQDKKEEVKLFDFGSAEIKESFVDNPDQGPPLDSHKMYLNIVYNDRVLPPLNQAKDFADPTNDATWQIIPVAFTEAIKRKNVSGCEVITYDGHVNTCVFVKMMASKDKFQSILHYIV